MWDLGTLLVTIKYRRNVVAERQQEGQVNGKEGLIFHEKLWSPKGQWAFLPMSRTSKPLPGVEGAGFPRIPSAMWFWFRAAWRGSCG